MNRGRHCIVWHCHYAASTAGCGDTTLPVPVLLDRRFELHAYAAVFNVKSADFRPAPFDFHPTPTLDGPGLRPIPPLLLLSSLLIVLGAVTARP